MTTVDDCPNCGGDGTVEVDDYSQRHGHYTLTEPCPSCTSLEDRREIAERAQSRRGAAT